jgi:abequosyltransferase
MSEGQQRRSASAEPLLTLAIPTYNRAACLRECLSVLADQVQNEPRVELMISDNASPDETPAVVQDFVDRGLRILYIRNRENIGPDANFLQCFEQARGKYVWLFSDDDLIIPGGLAKILTYCADFKYDLIWVSGFSFAEFHIPIAAKEGRDALEMTSAREYTKRVHVFFTFISGNIINKETVLAAREKPFSGLIGTSLGQLGWTYTALNNFNRGLYIREKLIAVRANNTGGYKLFQVFGLRLAAVTHEWLHSAELAAIVLNGTVQRFWPLLLHEYKKNAELFAAEATPREVLTATFGANFRYWLFAYPLMALPGPLAQIWFAVIRVVNRIDKAMGYPLLEWGVADTPPPPSTADASVSDLAALKPSQTDARALNSSVHISDSGTTSQAPANQSR